MARGRGGGSLSRGCHCCCLVPACDRCNRRAARPDDTGQTKPQAALERTLDADVHEKGGDAADHLRAVTAHCRLSAGHTVGGADM